MEKTTNKVDEESKDNCTCEGRCLCPIVKYDSDTLPNFNNSKPTVSKPSGYVPFTLYEDKDYES